ncbi:MAG: hypothetical protein ACFE0O_03485 [Opitutales bacterium]
MGDPSSDDKPKKDDEAVDLSELQGLTFGPDWGSEKRPQSGSRSGRSGGAGRDAGPRGNNEPRKDRRPPRRPGGRPSDSGPRGDRRPGGRPTAPPFQPVVHVDFYPEDEPFAVLAKALRASYRTYELFEIARLILEKPERHVFVLRPLEPDARERDAVNGPDAIYLSVPDGLPFESEEAAVTHVLKHHIGRFFVTEEVEVEPPKGNFPVINRCKLTGELLGPPNYHRYQELVQRHYASRISNMPFDRYLEKIESVRDEEAVNAWLDKMRKTTRYTLRTPGVERTHASSGDKQPADETGSAEAATAEASPPPEPDAKGASNPPEAETAAEPETTEVDAPSSAASEDAGSTSAVAPDAPSFEGLEAARRHLLTHEKERVVRSTDSARISGRLLAEMPEGRLKRSVEAAREQQIKFPLETANHLRGRLRRLQFHIYKKGSKGVSYVCAVKRRFRDPDTVFADSINELVEFIEKHPMIPAADLPEKMLGFKLPKDGESLEADQDAKLKQLKRDLRWLITEGYVTEYGDGKLFAPEPMQPPGSKPKKSSKARPAEEKSGEAPDTSATETAPAPETDAANPAKKAEPAEDAPAQDNPTPPVDADPAEDTPEADPDRNA